MIDIEKKSKVKHWKYDFLFVHRESGWGNVPDGTRVSLLGTPFGSPQLRKEKWPQFYIQEDDKRQPIPKFMAQMIESMRGPEKRKSKSSDREPLNWLPRLKIFGNDFFLAAAGLLIFKNFSKGIGRLNVS